MKNGFAILKKNPAYNIEKYDSLFFSIGLALSLGLVVLLFEWKTYDLGTPLDLTNDSSIFEELLDIPNSQQEPPPPPPQKSSKSVSMIVEVPNVEEIEQEIELDLDIEMTEGTEIAVYEQIEHVEFDSEIEEEIIEEIFLVVEEQPQPVGGYEAFYNFIYDEIKYPDLALRYRVEGRVFIQFVVEKDGSLTDFVVARGIGIGCDEESIRVLQLAPKWNPGKQRGKPVRVRMILPISFRIAGETT